MRDLARFQYSFGAALLQAPRPEEETRKRARDLALRIHRNTAMKGLVDALAANYPTVAQLVGEEWFRACAIEFARSNPARTPVLALYGEAFPGFLSSFPPAAQLPYLADVARIDRMWIGAHFAPDAIFLSAATLEGLPPSALGQKRLTLHPAARFGSVRHSAATIWTHHRSAVPNRALTIADCEEGILITRPAGTVEYALMPLAALRFLHCLSDGEPMSAAATAMLDRDADADVAGALATALAAGAFASGAGPAS
ncbi:MAG: DNA-binding domain-containing protein [Gammaproteobacteria bacterium]